MCWSHRRVGLGARHSYSLCKPGGVKAEAPLFTGCTFCKCGRWLNGPFKAVVFASFLELRGCRTVSQDQKIDVRGESKGTLEPPAQAGVHKGGLEPGLTLSPALMVWVTCRRNCALCCRAKHTPGQGGGGPEGQRRGDVPHVS